MVDMQCGVPSRHCSTVFLKCISQMYFSKLNLWGSMMQYASDFPLFLKRISQMYFSIYGVCGESDDLRIFSMLYFSNICFNCFSQRYFSNVFSIYGTCRPGTVMQYASDLSTFSKLYFPNICFNRIS